MGIIAVILLLALVLTDLRYFLFNWLSSLDVVGLTFILILVLYWYNR